MSIYRKRYPWNFALLLLFTLCISFTLGMMAACFSELSVVMAVAITFCVFVGLSLYVVYSKQDFSGWGPFLASLMIVIVSAIFIQVIVWYVIGISFPVVNMVIAAFSSLLFSGYIIFDTYMILNRTDCDDFVMGAASLYIDVLNLFSSLLRLIEGCRNGSTAPVFR